MIRDAEGAVLAGGAGSRFGSDKASAPWPGDAGRTTLAAAAAGRLLAVLPRVMVVSKTPLGPGLDDPRLRLVEDLLPGRHPLVGLLSALEATAEPWVFACGCDMPFVRPGLIERLAAFRAGFDAVVPLWKGRSEPLCAFYARSTLPALRAFLRPAPQGGGAQPLGGGALPQGGAARFALTLRSRWVAPAELRSVDPEGLSFMDLDDQPAYRRAMVAADDAAATPRR